jgi:type III secretion protein L
MLIWSSPAGASLLAEHGIVRAHEFATVTQLDDILGCARDEAEAIRRRAEEEAADIVDAALQQAAQVLDEARAEAAAMREQAEREAADEAEKGYEEGQRAAAVEWHTRLAELQALRDVQHEGMEDRLATIVAQAVERIVRGGPREAVFARALQGVRETLREAGGARLVVHPDDAEAARAALNDEMGLAADGVRVQVEADPTVTAGTCVFDSALGRLDASLDVQLAGIRAALQRATRMALADAAEQGSGEAPLPTDDGEQIDLEEHAHG